MADRKEGRMTLIEFLLERIADDEKIGEMLQRTSLGEGHRVQVLAEVEAKRRIVTAYIDDRDRRDIYQSAEGRAAELDETVDPLIRERQIEQRRSSAARCRGLEIAVEALASVYSDHPDFDAESWGVEDR